MMTSRNIELDTLDSIAKPLVSKMKTLKAPLMNELDEYIPFTHYLMGHIGSLLLATVLHILGFYLYHRFHGVRRLVPRFLKVKKDEGKEKQKVPLKPFMCFDEADGPLPPQSAKKAFVFSEQQLRQILNAASEFEQPRGRSRSMLGASRSSINTVTDSITHV